MESIKVGDIVSRKSYNSDIYFRVASIEQGDNEKLFILKGLSFRILADSDEADLILIEDENKQNCTCSVKCTRKHNRKI